MPWVPLFWAISMLGSQLSGRTKIDHTLPADVGADRRSLSLNHPAPSPYSSCVQSCVRRHVGRSDRSAHPVIPRRRTPAVSSTLRHRAQQSTLLAEALCHAATVLVSARVGGGVLQMLQQLRRDRVQRCTVGNRRQVLQAEVLATRFHPALVMALAPTRKARLEQIVRAQTPGTEGLHHTVTLGLALTLPIYPISPIGALNWIIQMIQCAV